MIMGIQKWGLLGGFQNKVGPAVGHYTNGQNVVTALPHPSQKPATLGQLTQRLRFSTVVSFIGWLTPIIRVGFANEKKEKQSAFNAAFAYNYANALTGTYPNFVMDYPEVMFSRGKLSGPYTPEIETTVVAELKFNWLGNIKNGVGAPTDMATLVVYNPLKGEFETMVNAAPRSALTYTMLLPGDYSGDTVQVYMSFVSADGKTVSNSSFIGAIEVL